MARLAESGSLYPPLLTAGIATVLLVWALYALSAAGRIRRLPLLRTVLIGVSAVYLLRALGFVALMERFPENSLAFWLWTSAICLVIGLLHLVGIHRAWPRLRPR